MGVFSKAFSDFATEQRGWFVLFFVLPFSLCFDFYYSARSWLVMKFHSAPALHETRVKDIQKQILNYQKSNQAGKKLCTARGGWQSISPSMREYKNQAQKININLYDILHFDEKQKTIKVEPMVNMGQLSHFLIPKGYTIPVLPEMDDLTCGGLYMGVGIETSSHKYGLFNDSVVGAEIVTASGALIKCSKTENRELFDALPWSYGTLGFLVSLTIRVIRCQPYVKMWYIPTTNAEQSSEIFKATSHKKKNDAQTWKQLSEAGMDYFTASAAQHEFDFVESLMYSRDKMITMPAKFVSESEVKYSHRNQIGLWYKQWFFKHVESFFGTGNADVDVVAEMKESNEIEKFLDENFKYEFIPLRHYYHRHTKSIFWELEEIIPFGNHFLVRYLLGWALPPKVSFLKITQTESIRKLYEQSHCIQDMMVPEGAMDCSLDTFEDQYGIYPLWICPYRAYDYTKVSKFTENKDMPHRHFLKKPENVEAGEAYELYVDLGAYGVPKAVKEKKPFDVVKVSRVVEQFVHSVHGFQMLYATSYQSRSEFRQMFDHRFYDKMKAKYDPKGNFPKVYEKTCKQGLNLWERKKR